MARLWYLTRVDYEDGDFYAMLKAGRLPSGSVSSYAKHSSLSKALAEIGRYYELQRDKLIRITRKPIMHTAIDASQSPITSEPTSKTGRG